jgi:hypothetical protein
VLGLLQPSLKFEHGRILKINHAKGAKAAIVKLMDNFTFLPRVFEFKNLRRQDFSECVKMKRFLGQSDSLTQKCVLTVATQQFSVKL